MKDDQRLVIFPKKLLNHDWWTWLKFLSKTVLAQWMERKTAMANRGQFIVVDSINDGYQR